MDEDKSVICEMVGVRGGEEEVFLVSEEGTGRLMVRAINEAGFSCTEVDLLDLITWLKANRPDLIAAGQEKTSL